MRSLGLRTAALFLGGVLSALAANPARSQNLLNNPTFASTVGGWVYSGATPVWSPLDANGSPSSGSMQIANTSSGNEGAIQCVLAQPERTYYFSGKSLVPSGQDRTGYSKIMLFFTSTPDCSTVNLIAGPGQTPLLTTFDTWTTIASSVVAPANAKGMQFYTVAHKNETGSQFRALFDDLSLELGSTLTVPAGASIHGNAGAFFHTDLWVMNRSYGSSQTVTARYRCFTGQSCGLGTKTFTLAPRQSILSADVIGGFFNAPDTAGAIELTYDPLVGNLSATSRTYTPDLPNPTNGTAIPALAANETRTRALFLGLGANGGNLSSGFRSNAGAYNPNTTPVSITFTLYDGDSGTVLGSPLTRSWAANEAYQISDIFAAVGFARSVTTNAYLVVAAGEPVFPYVTVIDNQSGDSVYVSPSSDEAP